MTRTIAIANQKGGVGKTTTCWCLGAALNELGKKVLLVDIDPQASLSIGVGVPKVYNLKQTIYQVLMGKIDIGEIIYNLEDGIDIVPSNIDLAAAQLQLMNKYHREDRLKNALVPIKQNYDYILIDCPPALGLLTVNALSAADSVLIPLSCEYYAMVGISLLLDIIEGIREEVNPNLKILGILPTRYDKRTLHSREVLQRTRAEFERNIRVFDMVIKETVRFKETPVAKESILKYASDSEGAEAYRQLAKVINNE